MSAELNLLGKLIPTLRYLWFHID